MKGDGGITVAAETKWSTGTKLEALDETPWDVIKLVHARATVTGVRWALLITAAPSAAFEIARYARMFDEAIIATSELLSLNPHMYEEDSKSRPQAAPVRTVLPSLPHRVSPRRKTLAGADGEHTRERRAVARLRRPRVAAIRESDPSDGLAAP